MTKPKFRQHANGELSLVVGDGFQNIISGLGAANVKQSGAKFTAPIYSQHDLENAYRTSTWFGKIVDIPAEDATREWRRWQAGTADVSLIEAEERRLNIQPKVLHLLKMSRLYGGAVMVMGGLPGDPATPVNMNAIRKGSLAFVTILTRDEIQAGEVVRDPLSPYHGEPVYYTLTGGQAVKIHASRVVAMNGPRISGQASGETFWGDPVWFRLQSAATAADQSGAVLDALLQEAKVDVIRINDLTRGGLTQEYEERMLRRFQLVAILKGMQNVMLLDKDDEWSQKTMTWTGLPEVARHILNVLSGAADIPMFRLTGQNLTGLSSTGDGETRAYYDLVKANQTLRYAPALTRLDEVLIRSALGARPQDVWYDWASLYQLSDKEKAEVDKLESETAANLVSSGLIPSDALAKAVQNRMVESGRWPGLESALAESVVSETEREADIAAELDRITESGTAQPPEFRPE